ncbi:MAG: transposase [Planctomycetaceae bacterium]
MPAEDESLTPLPTAVTIAQRRSYPTDVNDWQWRKLRPLVDANTSPRGRPRETELREVLSALCYRWRTRCSWRMLPHDFPPWPTVYAYERGWRHSGTLDEIQRQLGFPPSSPAC